MKRNFVGLIAAACGALLIGTGTAAAAGIYATGTTGVDLSWANCGTTAPRVSFGIVGVTGGTVYSTNSCVAAEARQFRSPSLYANTGWYDQSTHLNATSPRTCVTTDANCMAYNYGYNAGIAAWDSAASAGVTSSTWWLDVETENTWNADVAQNRQSIQGETDALRAKGASSVGIYSQAWQWNQITGGWINNWPNWVATGASSALKARTYCTNNRFTGGLTYLAQYKSRGLDYNYAC